MLAPVVMGCFTVILKPVGSLSTILITRPLITIMITDQDTDSKYFCAGYKVVKLQGTEFLTTPRLKLLVIGQKWEGEPRI